MYIHGTEHVTVMYNHSILQSGKRSIGANSRTSRRSLAEKLQLFVNLMRLNISTESILLCWSLSNPKDMLNLPYTVCTVWAEPCTIPK